MTIPLSSDAFQETLFSQSGQLNSKDFPVAKFDRTRSLVQVRRNGRTAVLLVLLISCFSYKSSDSLDSQITFTTSRGNFTITVDAEGELEAKTAHVLSAPHVHPAPEISYLAPEASVVEVDDVVVTFESEQIEKDYKNAQDELEIARAEVKTKEADLKLQRFLLESQMRSSEAAVAISRLQLPKLEFVAPRVREIERLKMAKSEMEVEKNRKKLQSLEAIQQEELTSLQLKVNQEENKVERAQLSLDKLVLRTPVAGIVVHEKNPATGRKVQEGDMLHYSPVVKIPDLSVMQVKLQIGETEAQQLKTEQKATVTVSSLGDFHLSGKVTKVENIAKPIRRDSKVKKVEVIVEIDSTDVDLVPGLTARCSIIGEEIPDVLAIPLECIFEKDSLKVAYVRRESAFVPQEVTLAKRSNDFAVIDSGLTVGEELALREPSSSLIPD